MRGGLTLHWDVRSLGGHPIPLWWVQSFEITILEYSLTLQTLDTIAANRVAIDRYQCVRVLQARFVSVISTDDSRHLLLFANILKDFPFVKDFSYTKGKNVSEVLSWLTIILI